jgi:hypothetical protein
MHPNGKSTSVKISLGSGWTYNCDDVLQMVINYGSLYNTSEWTNLISMVVPLKLG